MIVVHEEKKRDDQTRLSTLKMIGCAYECKPLGGCKKTHQENEDKKMIRSLLMTNFHVSSFFLSLAVY